MRTLGRLLLWIVGLVLVAAVAVYLLVFRGVERPELAMKAIEFTGKETPGQHDCFWIGPVTFDAFNTAFPDKGAIYWPTIFTYPKDEADSYLEIKGTYPRARYTSYHSYVDEAVPYDHLNDIGIQPDDGATNPFVTGQYEDGQTYTLRVYPNALPENPESNALYLGDLDQTSSTGIMLRTYLPETPGDESGGARLPQVTMVRMDGTRVEGQALCDLLNSPAVGDPRRQIAAPVIAQETYARLFSRDDVRADILEAANSEWTVFWDPRIAVSRLMSPRVSWLFKTAAGAGLIRKTSGFFANFDNEYVSMYVNTNNGPVIVLEGKLPRTPETGAESASDGEFDMRYWSLCTNEGLATTRYSDCVYDSAVATDDDRNYTIVVSKAGERPENATLECGVTWLDFGETGDGGGNADLSILILRNMLPSDDFAHAVQDIPSVGAEKATMGDYLPIPAYTTKADFEARGC